MKKFIYTLSFLIFLNISCLNASILKYLNPLSWFKKGNTRNEISIGKKETHNNYEQLKELVNKNSTDIQGILDFNSRINSEIALINKSHKNELNAKFSGNRDVTSMINDPEMIKTLVASVLKLVNKITNTIILLLSLIVGTVVLQRGFTIIRMLKQDARNDRRQGDLLREITRALVETVKIRIGKEK